MKSNTRVTGIGLCLSASILMALSPSAIAGQGDGTLVTTPLFLENGADPNILFLLDSSGSMEGERNSILRSSTVRLINALEKVNFGLARFSKKIPFIGSLGGRLLAEVKSIDDPQHQRELLRQANALPAKDSTPLATALWEIGGYFTQGGKGEKVVNEKLTLWPKTKKVKAKARSLGIKGAVFSNSWSGLASIYGPINQKHWCARNIITLLTDGEPSSDSHLDRTLGIHDYDNDGDSPPTPLHIPTRGSTFLDDIAMMLDDVDLRPDVHRLDKDGNNIGKMKNKITTHVIAFGGVGTAGLLADTQKNVKNGLLLTAGDENQLDAAFKKITHSTLQQTATGSSINFSKDFISTETIAFQTVFHTTNWNGNVVGRPLNVDGSVDENCQPGNFCWSAANLLENRAAANRSIYTLNGDNQRPLDFIANNFFSFSAQQQQDIQQAMAESGKSSADVINYLRGDPTFEGVSGENTLRPRTGKLGDIIHSEAIFYGKPSMPWRNDGLFPSGLGLTYGDFINAKRDREAMVYVGANDGMLHAFNAKTGKEAFAYIPHAVFSGEKEQGLHYLASQVYFHKGYVDNTPSITDAFVNGAWKTILVGSLRGGGRSVFALDVTNPANFRAQDVLWEFTHPDLGLTYARPTVVMTNVKNAQGEQRWAAIFGNGYDSGKGAKLFVVFLDNPNNFVVLNAGPITGSNGLARAELADDNGDGTVDRVYAGDMEGDLYVFDLSGDSVTEWRKPQNTAKLYNGSPDQPLTTKPAVGRHPTQPGLMVYFGTGSFITKGDDDDGSSQSFIGLWDDKSNTTIRRASLRKVGFDPVTGGTEAKVLKDENINWTGSGKQAELGWVIDLEDEKERAINEPVVLGGYVFFNTIVPDNSTPCIVTGYGWLYSLDAENGASPDQPLFDITNDAKVDANDVVKTTGAGNDQVPGALKFEDGLPLASKFIGNTRVTVGTGGTAGEYDDDGEPALPKTGLTPTGPNGSAGLNPVGFTQTPGRLNWEEVR